jgi:hypothetical protein
MRKILFSLASIGLLVMSGQVFATVEIGSGDNAVIVGSHMGPSGITPVTEVIKVSTGTTTSAEVGDVMVWDYSNAADGYHVKRASANDSDGTQVFAGVMVTPTSQDSTYSYSNPKNGSPTVGYMAVRGLVRAKMDTSKSTAGDRLALNGSSLAASFCTYKTTHTYLSSAGTTLTLSEDIGICFETSASYDGPNRVWLK